MKQFKQFRHLGGMLAVVLLAGTALAFPPAPADSPKDNRIFFTAVSGEDHKIQIGVMNADGSKRTILTKGDAHELDPAPSPNGKRLAFVAMNKETETVDVWVMNMDGKERKKLTEHAPKTFAVGVSWSPDGKRLAFSAVTGLGGGPPDAQIMVMDADGKNAAPLGKGMLPAWSPDGKKILYTGLDDGPGKEPRLAIMDADGKNAKNLTTTPALMGAWSPDGKKIVYAGAVELKEGKPHLFVSKPDATDATQLTMDDGDLGELAPQWSPDGKRIYCCRMALKGRGDKAGIWVMDADGKNLKELSKGDGMEMLGGAGLFVMMHGRASSKP